NRRVLSRYPVTKRCLYHPIQPGERPLWEAMIQDISLGGLRLTAHRVYFKRGEVLTIEVPNLPEGGRDKLFVRVRNTTHQGAFSVAGCSFIKKLSADELQALLLTLPGGRPFRHPL